MTRKKFGIALMLTALVLNTTGASACGVEKRESANGGEQSKAKTKTPPAAQQPPAPIVEGEENLGTKVSGEVKELAAGSYSSVRAPFVAVARDAATYAELRQLQEGLPELGADFFKTNVVVAAFLGQRSSGGYGVRITRGGAGGTGGVLRVSEKTPAKGGFSTMALTFAFQIVSVPVDEETPLGLELDAAWSAAGRPYKVDAGEFTRMGGFAGRRERSTLAGNITVMRHARLATLFFTLLGTGAEGQYELRDVATGTLTPEGALTLARLDPGSFVPPPRHPLKARGQFSDNEGKLSLTFEVMEAKVNDGFGGQGKLEATATAPPPKKRAADEDDPM